MWSGMSRSLQIAAKSAMGWMTPVSLLASMAATSVLRLRASCAEIVDADDAVGVDAEAIDVCTRFGRGASASVVMLGCSMAEMMRCGIRARSRGDRPAAVKNTADGEVVGFGAAAGEDYSVAGACTEEFGDAVAGVFQGPAGAAAEFVLAGWVEIGLAPAGAHRFDDFRENGRRGVVVEVDSAACWQA